MRKYETKNTQINGWEEFYGIYRVIERIIKRHEDLRLIKDGIIIILKEPAKVLTDVFYPESTENGDNDYHQQLRKTASQVHASDHAGVLEPPLTLIKLKSVVESFNLKKAPGEDGLTADICS